MSAASVAFQEVEDNLAALRVLESEARTAKAAVTVARNAVELSTSRYKRGSASYLEVLTNQTVALTDERAAAAISTRRVFSSVQLVMALGGGWNAAQMPKN